MDVVVNLDAESLKGRKNLFADFHILQRVWTHPYTLIMHREGVKKKVRDKKFH